MRKRKSMVKGQSRRVGTSWSIWLMLVMFSLSASTLFSQKVSTLVSKDKIVLGEQFFVKIKVDGVTDGQIKQDFQFPDTVNHLEIIADSIDTFGSSTIIHTLTVTSFDSGYWELPSFRLILADNRTLTTTSLPITVLPVDVSTLQDYHDIKDVLEVNPENDWLIVGIIVLLALLSLFAVLWFINKKKEAVPEKKISASALQLLYEKTINKINTLQKIDVSKREQLVSVFAEATALTRTFIDKAYHQNTLHLTTGEYILVHKNKFSEATLADQYFQFFRLADAVKFARYIPPEADVQSLFPILKDLITSVYQQTKTNN